MRKPKTNRHILVHPLFWLLIVASLFLSFFRSLLLVYGVTLLHELAHMAAARAFGVKVRWIRFMPFGIEMRLREEQKIPARKMAWIAAAGPACNLILAGAAYFLRVQIPYQLYETLLLINLMLALVNLMPTMPLDGGKILKALLLFKYNEIGASKRTLLISKVTTLLMLGGGVFLFFTAEYNFSLILIGAFVLGYILAENRESQLLEKKILFNYKEKLKESGRETIAVHSIAVKPDIPLRRLVKKFELEQYNMILVLDEQMRVQKRLTEGDIVDGMLSHGAHITLAQIL